ncbi:hypothetical protein A3C98_00390 [Candidatus Roizmanbacteria bacterium RIFCSPHIGHO2_02_FULL_37_15]|uniref:Uncharacterized protein n=1 Tax=Candidatus Roizmanbacteria bacterium RIFCSPLOWO2_01_FULL_37_16 TaxID=1802058 RepID=A0A1F7IQS8_9BACT|nr:MAG: hypothetical protein A2859_02565 [Candidatus Roizmanbacteria bacterium RIFCSPHIGHO2_01_FULL_37_16b]OGK22193.1 MAG: hypothetical protein A3C98_00390 [Candidatus Roizmanbacteria bacterium RIFCSPHIGHO2_02_FULL_37_15]OGK31413.1 MAG: hypothetical protein A3F57_01300 [Candidatus Roizmanbacteria bacterium RIFCSPHIGHO2_12_FULL_36_11]OGK45710.1 MAG: hypothetical protein A3B40_05525 [Candidatus Roizmanbacteria bacterium RIFCSPLOWO2_01_FULL_37_16]OGK57398.1 MAG: hypothetical protein A3I50_00200 [C
MSEFIKNGETGQRVFHLPPRVQAAFRVPVPEVERLNGIIIWEPLLPRYVAYFKQIYQRVSPILSQYDTTNIESLWTHYHFGLNWWEVLYQYDGIKGLIPGQPLEYPQVLFLDHDKPRIIGNTKLPLLSIEHYAKRVQRRMLLYMFSPREVNSMLSHLHTTDWMTGREIPPRVGTASASDLMQLVNKGVDNAAKKFEGELVNPSNILKTGGLHDQWLENERQKGTFPGRTWGHTERGNFEIWPVTLEEYARRDRDMIQEAFTAIEGLTGETMHNLWLQVKAKLDDAR